jgi:hypothetical protein
LTFQPTYKPALAAFQLQFQLDSWLAMNRVNETKFSTIVNKYPTHRDEYVKGCWKWLKGRRADDSAEGLWRVNDKLYDLTSYVDRHPGGREWLVLAKVN